MTAPVPSQLNIQTALQQFLQAIPLTPSGIEIVEGQDNRVPEPVGPDYIVMTPIRRPRLRTNVDKYLDCRFVASISGTTMTVSSISFGAILVNATVFGATVGVGGIIQKQLTGATGGVGTYQLDTSQTAGSQVMASGAQTFEQAVDVVIQLDVHGPNSADNATVISTLFRDAFATDFFANTGFDVAPLYADDPKQMPFLNAEHQYETQWIVEAHLQANQVVSMAQQFADQVNVTLKEVDATFHP